MADRLANDQVPRPRTENQRKNDRRRRAKEVRRLCNQSNDQGSGDTLPATAYQPANHQALPLRTRAQKKNDKRREKNAVAGRRLPFKPPTKIDMGFQFSLHAAATSKLAENSAKRNEVEARKCTPVWRAVGNVGIQNPNYVAGSGTPRWAALRLVSCLEDKDRELLLKVVEHVRKTGLKGKVTKAHGSTFFQLWLGLWARYTGGVFISANTRTDKDNQVAAVKALRDLLNTATQ